MTSVQWCQHTPDAHRHWPLGWKVHVDGGLGLTGTTTTRATQHVATLHVWPGMQRMVPLTYPDGHVMPCVPHSVWVATHVLPEHLQRWKNLLLRCRYRC
jgi:hypothetical protein